MGGTLSMAKHLYFVRHGESNSNADGVFRGEESSLSEKGEKEARTVAERMQRIGIDAIVSSPFLRTMQTAEPISQLLDLPIEEDDLLIEFRWPSMHIGKSRNDPEMQELRDAVMGNFGVNNYTHSDEESFDEFKDRTKKALTLLEQHPAERLCVVTHGIFLRMMLMVILHGDDFTGKEFKGTWNLALSNTGVTYAKKVPTEEWHNSWNVVSWNDSSHLG